MPACATRSRYLRTLDPLGAERTLAIATTAVRAAENGDAFLGEDEWSYGFATQLFSGEDEARLTRRGVAADRELAVGTLIVDIGGGSTELILDERPNFLRGYAPGALGRSERVLFRN